MKVKFLKRHTGHKPGDVAEIKDSVATYLIKLGVAAPVDEEPPEETAKKLTKKLKAVKKKK